MGDNMFFSDASITTIILFMLPAVINLWAIWHAMTHRFDHEKEKMLWILGAIFLPVFGGLLYLFFGLRRSKPLY